jgi:hypothetical protein
VLEGAAGMSITTSPEERRTAEAKLVEKTDEQLRAELAYWAVLAADYQDRWNELIKERDAVGEFYHEAQAWQGLVTAELQKRRRRSPAPQERLS